MYENKKEPNYLLITFIIAELIYCIVIGFIMNSLLTGDNITIDFAAQPTASITGLPPFLSDTDSKTIGNSLYSLMLQNTENKQLLNQDAFAVVSSDSAYHFDNQGFTLFSATLDAPNLDQSYKLFYGYPDEDNGSFQQFTSILCTKSPVKLCTSSLDYTDVDIVHNFLPYIEFDRFSVYFTEDEPQKINITPVLPTNGNTNIESSYIDEIKSTLSTLGLSPDSFTYHIVTPAEFNYNIQD